MQLRYVINKTIKNNEFEPGLNVNILLEELTQSIPRTSFNIIKHFYDNMFIVCIISVFKQHNLQYY